jgi:hypothetical protein
MTVYDWSDPGASGTVSGTDQIGFVVKDNKGKLLYSTNYYSTAQKDPTLVQDLAAGNIQVNSSAFKAAELTNLVSVVRDINLVTTTLKVYPNPFSDWLRFEFISPVDADARIDIFDITGRKVQTVFHKQVKAGIDYIADFKPVSNVSGMYLYLMTLGDEVFNGKVMYKR